MSDGWRRTGAVVLVGLGIVGLIGGIFLPGTRSLLFALGGTGILFGVLIPYVFLESTPATSVASSLCRSYVANMETVLTDIGVGDSCVYRAVGTGDGYRCELLVPKRTDSTTVDGSDLDTLLRAAHESGITLRPSGIGVFERIEQALPGGLSEEPESIAVELLDGFAEQFELIDGGTITTDENAIQVTVFGVTDGPVDRFDHPVASTVGVGLAIGMNREVVVDTSRSSTRDDQFRINCRWESNPEEWKQALQNATRK